VRLPPELESWRERIDALARELGLDYFPVEYEVVDWDTMAMVASYGGFPRRYPHWRHGMAYDELQKSYRYGLSKLYELVINTDPVIAYLLASNPIADQKLVMAHVYGHADFFKNNSWFAGTNRKMLDEVANHAASISRYIDRYGLEAVESFMDIALSLDNLIDPYTWHVRRPKEKAEAAKAWRPDVKPHLERYVLVPEAPPQDEDENGAAEPIPARPERDVLAFLVQHAPLRDWQRHILGMVREEAYYFAPQGMTKVMNEGWASYWHSHMMTRTLAGPDEIVHYADVNAGVMGGSGRLNPYKLGLLLWREIEERWDKGRHGPEYDACDDLRTRRSWDTGEVGAGRARMFEVRRTHNDVMFVDEFLTQDFSERHQLFTYELTGEEDQFVVASREFREVKARLLAQLTNSGQPIIRVIDANGDNRGELVLAHAYEGEDLDIAKAKLTLEGLQKLWTRPVRLETEIEGARRILRYDGSGHQLLRDG
jgi:stage V sporulation protein R